MLLVVVGLTAVRQSDEILDLIFLKSSEDYLIKIFTKVAAVLLLG